MRYRRIIYMAVAAFLLLYLFKNNPFEPIIIKPPVIEASVIIKDFEDLTDNPELSDESKNEAINKNLYIPIDYTGQAGEVFYLTADVIYKYKIELIGDKQETLTYSLKDSFQNISLPETKFNIYELNK